MLAQTQPSATFDSVEHSAGSPEHGIKVGDWVGAADGDAVGVLVVGEVLGLVVGAIVGEDVVGDPVGEDVVGEPVGEVVVGA